MIVGIGTDIVDVNRFLKNIDDDNYLSTFFSKREIDCFNAKGKNKLKSVAGSFAAKEAFVKSLGKGFGDIKIKDVEVLHNSLGAPNIHFDKTVLERIFLKYSNINIFVTISHEKDYALAFVILDGELIYEVR